jgi:hypothetical protein
VAAGWSLSGAESIAEVVRGQFVSGAGSYERGMVCVQAGVIWGVLLGLVFLPVRFLWRCGR